MQWMAVTFRATCFGPLGLWSNPSSALTPGKVIGLDWTNVRYGWHLTIGQRGGVLHGGREHLRGWEGRVCFTWFHLVCKFPWLFAWLSPWLVCVGCFCCLFGWVGCWFLSLGKFVFNHKLTPGVDRPSLALVRQCRKKKDWTNVRSLPRWDPRDGEGVPTLVSTPIDLNVREEPPDSVSHCLMPHSAMSLLWYCAYIGKCFGGLGAVAFIHWGISGAMVLWEWGAIPWCLQTTVYPFPASGVVGAFA